MLSVRFPVNWRLLVVKVLGGSEVRCGFSIVQELVSLPPVFKGQLYFFNHIILAFLPFPSQTFHFLICVEITCQINYLRPHCLRCTHCEEALVLPGWDDWSSSNGVPGSHPVWPSFLHTGWLTMQLMKLKHQESHMNKSLSRT